MPAPKSIVELQDDLKHRIQCADDLQKVAEKENRILTSEERAASKKFLDEADQLQTLITAHKEHEAEKLRLDAMRAGLAKVPAPPAPTASAPGQLPVLGNSHRIKGYRSGSLKAFKGPDAEFNAYQSGQFINAVLFGSERARGFCHDHGIDLRNAQTEGSNTKGGFLVPAPMLMSIIDLREQYGVFRRYADVQPMASDTLYMPRRVGGSTAYFVGEGVAITESDATWDSVTLVAKKMGCLTKMSSELNEDTIISMTDKLASEMAYAFAYKEDLCGWNGDGTNTYGGIVGARTKILTLAGAIDAGSGHDTFAEIDKDDLAKVMAALPAYAEPNAKWYCSKVAWDLVFARLMAAAGGNSTQTLAGNVERSYLGYPVVISQALPTAQTDISDTAMLFFGDLAKAATLGDRRGVTISTTDALNFAEDQIAIKATQRVDIVVHSVGDASTPGPLVALIGE